MLYIPCVSEAALINWLACRIKSSYLNWCMRCVVLLSCCGCMLCHALLLVVQCRTHKSFIVAIVNEFYDKKQIWQTLGLGMFRGWRNYNSIFPPHWQINTCINHANHNSKQASINAWVTRTFRTQDSTSFGNKRASTRSLGPNLWQKTIMTKNKYGKLRLRNELS